MEDLYYNKDLVFTDENLFEGMASGFAISIQKTPIQCHIKVRRHSKEIFSKDLISTSLKSLRLKPWLPNKPVIVQLDSMFSLMPLSHVQGVLKIPLDLCLVTEADNVVCEIPLHHYKTTWFGTTEEGEECFSYKTSLHYGLDIFEFASSIESLIAYVPIVFESGSKNPVEIDSVSLPLELCALRLKKNHIFTDPIKIHYEASGDLTIKIGADVWSFISELPIIADARVSQSEKLLGRGILFLKKIAGFQIG